jgi:CubicO group peptidase (beta-lactamase class C family)
MTLKRKFRRFLKYLILASPAIVGMVFLVNWSVNKIHESPRYLAKHAFPSDSVFFDLDQAIIAKKAHQVDSVFKYLHKRIGFNGCILYAEQGHIVYQGAFGYADFPRRRKLTIESPFQLASLSKMFTAVAIMILKEKGRLNFDDSLKKFLPKLPYPGATIRHLMIHRSGIPNYMYIADDYWDRGLSMTNDQMIEMFVREKPRRYFTPSTGFNYCNTNYALLAVVIEKISGKTFEQFMDEEIFGPLEMDSTFIYRLPEGSEAWGRVPSKVQGHVYRRGRLVVEANYYLNGIVGDKGVYSTVGDMFKFDQALNLETLVSDTTLKEAFTSGSPRRSKNRDNYGFGFRIRAKRDSTVYHFGWWKGFRAYYIRDMAQEKSIIVLTNTDRGPSSNYYWKILDDHTYELGPRSSFPLN